MYSKILIPLENSAADQVILKHITQLARLTKGNLVLIHVADGFVARNQERFNLVDSEEITGDRQYLMDCKKKLEAEGFSVEVILEAGDPAEKILLIAEQYKVDLIAMATHGHRGLNDIILGSVASTVRHKTDIPVLLVRNPSLV